MSSFPVHMCPLAPAAGEAGASPAQAWHHPGPHCSSSCQATALASANHTLYNCLGERCPRNREESAFIDLCRMQSNCRSPYPELLVWGVCLERCLCPRSSEWRLLGPPGPEGSPIGHRLLLADPLCLRPPQLPCPLPHVVSGHTPLSLPPSILPDLTLLSASPCMLRTSVDTLVSPLFHSSVISPELAGSVELRRLFFSFFF